MAAKELWALDFDGVICDSVGESSISGWKVSCSSLYSSIDSQSLAQYRLEIDATTGITLLCMIHADMQANDLKLPAFDHSTFTFKASSRNTIKICGTCCRQLLSFGLKFSALLRLSSKKSES